MALAHFARDLRLGLRALARAPAFTTAAVLSLATGIAGVTAMFALVQGVLLRPLPVHEQDRVIVAWKELRSSGFAHYPFGGPDVEAVGRASTLLEAVAGVTSNGALPWVAIEDGSASYVNGALVTGAFFDVLGVEPVLGRAFTPADDVTGAAPVLVISHGLWQRQYGGSPDVIGRTLALGGLSFAIVGVMPPDLDYPAGVDVWRTVRSVAKDGIFGEAAHDENDLLARMRPGVTIEQASAEIGSLTARTAAAAPSGVPQDLVPVVRSIEQVIVGDARRPILALFAAVALVLLVASANAANLLLMRSEARRRDLAIRAALGAGRARIVGGLFAESLLLALAAGAAGLAGASAGLAPLVRLVPGGLPRVESVRIDPGVVLFAIAVALLTALMSALPPALSSMRADLVGSLRGSARRGGPAARRALVALQVALAVIVIAGAGLLARSLVRLQSVDLGLSAERLVFVDFVLPPAKLLDRARHTQFLDRVIERLEAMPAIAGATPVNVRPFAGLGGWDVPRFTAGGQSADRAAANPSLNLESVHPSYFATFGIPIVRGRPFTRADREGTVDVAIVSEDVAARTWPGDDPIGKRLKMGGPDSTDVWRTVVGVAAPTRYRELQAPRPTLYLPAAQFLMTARMLAVRSAGPFDPVASLARDAIRGLDADARVIRVAPFTEMLERPLARPRFSALLLGLFAAAALLLSAIGVYAVMAAFVRQRDREIGIRVALGASGRDVRRLVLLEALRIAGLGSAAGLGAAAALTRLLRGMLFEVDPLDSPALLGAVLLLVAAAALASYVPMRRAARLDPGALLRGE